MHMELIHEFEKGDFIAEIGSVVKVTDKAICVEFHNGKWCDGKIISKWIPKSALKIEQIQSGADGVLNDPTKHFITAELKNWFKL